jgi:hypothetical protein
VREGSVEWTVLRLRSGRSSLNEASRCWSRGFVLAPRCIGLVRGSHPTYLCNLGANGRARAPSECPHAPSMVDTVTSLPGARPFPPRRWQLTPSRARSAVSRRSAMASTMPSCVQASQRPQLRRSRSHHSRPRSHRSLGTRLGRGCHLENSDSVFAGSSSVLSAKSQRKKQHVILPESNRWLTLLLTCSFCPNQFMHGGFCAPVSAAPGTS